MQRMGWYVFVIGIFVVGVCFGTWLMMVLTNDQRVELWTWLKQWYSQPDSWSAADHTDAWQQTSISHMKWILFIWLCGLTVVGIPFVLLVNFFKGVMVGFTMGLFAVSASWHGIFAGAISILPTNLLLMPVMILISVSSIHFALTVIRERFVQKNGPVFPVLVQHSGIAFAILIVVVGISWVEVNALPVWMDWIWSHWPSLRIFV